MSSSKRYDYSQINKSSWVPLFIRRFFHRHPHSVTWIMCGGMTILLFHQGIIHLMKRIYMDKEEWAELTRVQTEEQKLRSRLGQFVNPFTGRIIDMLKPQEVQLLREREERDKKRKEKLLEEVPATKYGK